VKIFLSLCIFISALSCVYEAPDEMTFVNPQSIPPKITVQQLDLDKDTIVIWTNTYFNYNFSSDKQPIWGLEFDYFGKKFTKEGSNGYFEIDPSGQPDGVYKLKLLLYTRSGTGSLADNLGAEAYVFEKEWTLVVEKPVAPTSQITGTTIEDGFLTIQWEKCEQAYFHSYEIIVNDSGLHKNYRRRIYDADITSLTDSFFVGGKVDFTLLVHYYGADKMVYHSTSKVYVYRFPITLMFSESNDSLTVKWRNIPFRHTTYKYPSINIEQDSSFTILSPGLGYALQYQIDIRPTVPMDWENQQYNVSGLHALGVKSDMEFSTMVYYPDINIFFRKSEMFLRKNDGNTFKYLSGIDYSWDYYDNKTIALSKDKSRIFTTILQDMVELNSNLEIQKKEKYEENSVGRTFSMMRIINDSLMFLYSNATIAIRDYKRKYDLSTANIYSSDGAPFHISISRDGNYIANCGRGKMWIFKVTSTYRIEKIYETDGEFLECIFDPVYNDNLLVVTSESDYILHCPDQAVIYNIPDRIKGMAVNFDPVTNNLLFVSARYNTITVYNYQQDSVYYHCNHHGLFNEFYLARNNIFHGDGYHVNISQNE
jgi:hypothetical protein